MSTNLSSTYSNQDIVLHVGEIPKDVEATNGEVHNTKNKDAAKGEVRYTKNKVEPEVEIKTDKKKTLGTLELVRFFFIVFILLCLPFEGRETYCFSLIFSSASASSQRSLSGP